MRKKPTLWKSEQATGDNSIIWEATSGDPNGCLDLNDLVTVAGNIIIAPVAYHDDRSGMTAADRIIAGF